MRIYKQVLLLNVEQIISLPVDAKVLDVQVQHEQIAMWYAFDDSGMVRSREVIMVGTGHEIPSGIVEFIGTVQLNGGNLVLHIFLR